MHSRDPGKSHEDFGENMFAILQGRSNANRNKSRFDFTGFIFPDVALKEHYRLEVIFKNATFTLHANFSGSSFTEPVDFSEATFESDANFRQVSFQRAFKFSDAKFKGEVDFTGLTLGCPAEFSGVTFDQVANFSGSTFNNLANFSRLRATKEIKFSNATFQHPAQFTSATMTQADFSRAKFGQEATFVEATFLNRSNFLNAQFNSVVRFIRSIFENSVDFPLVQFDNDALFWNTTFTAGANFLGAVFRTTADFSHAVFGLRSGGSPLSNAIADFRDVRFVDQKLAVFHHVNNDSPQGLKIRLLKSDVEAVNFADIHWFGEGDRKLVLQDELDITTPVKIEVGQGESKDKAKRETKETRETPYEQVAITYRQLINNFEKVRAFDLAEDCWYGVREMKRLNPLNFVLAHRLLPYYKRWDWLRWFGERLSFLYLYQKASGYGCSHKRAFKVLILLILIFAVAYPVIGLDEITQDRHADHPGLRSISGLVIAFTAGLHHSLEVVTFQRSPVYVTPNHLGRLAEIIETILIAGQVSLFLLALRRRFRTGSSAGSA